MTFYAPTNGIAGGKRKTGYVPGRDSLVDQVMQGWQERYCTFSNVSICITTFNLNGKSAPARLPGWFVHGSKIADFYVIGLQEMDLSVGTYIIDNTKKMEGWLECIRASLPNSGIGFELISSMRLVGIFIALFRSPQSSVRISEVSSSYIATGISVLLNKLGNKGGTAISLRMNDTLVCFVNCHLAAGNGELERRNQDFRDISTIEFGNGLSIFDHEAVFWLGDLNYRINAETPGWSGEQVRAIASSSEFMKLFQYDQLREQQKLHRVFVGFQEPEVLPFRPTYKYDVNSNEWDSSEKARAPAWCDRVLWWRRDADTHIVQTSYESVSQISISDHKPVRASFSLTLRNIDQVKADKLYDEAIKEADRRANELLPQIHLSMNEVDFGEVKFLEPKCQLIKITNTGKSQVTFRFKPRPERELNSGWLQVTPVHFMIPVGISTEISLTIVIDKKIAWSLTETSLSDILVMSLQNGRDHFIPVSAKYYPRCYGVTLERLLSNASIREQNLIDFGDDDVSDFCPPNLPKEVYRLVSALRLQGAEKLDFSDVVDNSIFIRIRTALETNVPTDLTQLGVSSFSLYSALLRLVDSLKFPLIPPTQQNEFLYACSDASRLWALVISLPIANATLIEFIVTYLREIIAQRPVTREQIPIWADVLFRDSSTANSAAPRVAVLSSLCAYSKDVSMFGRW